MMSYLYDEALNEWSRKWYQFILDNVDVTDWNYWYLSRNPNVTWDIVQQNPDKPWNYVWLSSNPNITWNIVQQNQDKPWDYRYLSKNPNITRNIVQRNPDKPWDYVWLSSNPNITCEIVQQNFDKPWGYRYLTLIEETFERDAFIRKYLQEHFRKSDLKQELMERIFHPKNIDKFADLGFDEE